MTKKFAFILGASFIVSSCASKEKEKECPTLAEEPVSVCRAQEKCRGRNTSVGMGVGFSLGNVGLGVGGSQNTGRYADCIDKDLADQRKKQKESETKADTVTE